MSRSKQKRIVGTIRTLGCVLAGVLLVFELLAANTELHRALHTSGAASADTCALCQFANGQVDSPAPILTVSAPIPVLFELAPRWESAALADFPYNSSPSRAPPASPALLSVVA